MILYTFNAAAIFFSAIPIYGVLLYSMIILVGCMGLLLCNKFQDSLDHGSPAIPEFLMMYPLSYTYLLLIDDGDNLLLDVLAEHSAGHLAGFL